MKENSSIEDILRFVIPFIIIFLFLNFLGFMWKVRNEALEKMDKSMEIEGYEVIHYTKSCIDGKQFINAGRGITINLDMDGKPIPCNLKGGQK